jgi:hypothetical protein
MSNDYEKQRKRNIRKAQIIPTLADWLSALDCPEVKINIMASRIADDVLNELDKL